MYGVEAGHWPDSRGDLQKQACWSSAIAVGDEARLSVKAHEAGMKRFEIRGAAGMANGVPGSARSCFP